MSRILIVEDEPATALAVAESLEDDGHFTTHVTSAESALDLNPSSSMGISPFGAQHRAPDGSRQSFSRRRFVRCRVPGAESVHEIESTGAGG